MGLLRLIPSIEGDGYDIGLALVVAAQEWAKRSESEWRLRIVHSNDLCPVAHSIYCKIEPLHSFNLRKLGSLVFSAQGFVHQRERWWRASWLELSADHSSLCRENTPGGGLCVKQLCRLV